MQEHYQAARKAAAVVEQDWLGALKLTGEDRRTWLQGMVTNDVQKLTPGEGCYAAHLNAQGRLIAQMTVLIEEDALELTLERSSIEKLASVFDRLIIMEDVQVQNVSEQYTSLLVMGPDSTALVESWLGQALDLPALYAHRRFPHCRVVRTPLGYELWVRRDASGEVQRAIVERGAIGVDRETWNVVRTEAGMPVYGIDIDETTTMPELGEGGIDYDKGCYIGQEVVARIKYIGHVNRRFVGFVCEGAERPEIRSKVRSGGKEVGYVTTSVYSPVLGNAIALGFVARAAAAVGTAVELVGEKGTVGARVADLPFVQPVRL